MKDLLKALNKNDNDLTNVYAWEKNTNSKGRKLFTSYSEAQKEKKEIKELKKKLYNKRHTILENIQLEATKDLQDVSIKLRIIKNN